MIKEEKLVLIGAPKPGRFGSVLENEYVQHTFSRVQIPFENRG
jgi:hypothetical protein